MTDPRSNNRLEEEISHLRIQNRRYRELIQNLSSIIDLMRNRIERIQKKTRELSAFEDFGLVSRQLRELLAVDTRSAARRETRTADQGNANDLKPLVPNPGWKCLAVDEPQIRIGFTLFGMNAEAIEEAVEVVEYRQVRSRDFTPVFITDNADLRPFRIRGYVVEYISDSITGNSTGNRDLDRYLSARLELIKAKWGLGELGDLGRKKRKDGI
jgi:hypothetical protein